MGDQYPGLGGYGFPGSYYAPQQANALPPYPSGVMGGAPVDMGTMAQFQQAQMHQAQMAGMAAGAAGATPLSATLPPRKPGRKPGPKKAKAKKGAAAGAATGRKPGLTKSGKKKRPKDPDAPKRARTAFNFFLDVFRQEFKRDNPEVKGVVGITRAGSVRWKEMDEEAKAPFEAKAQAAREAYLKEKEAYQARGGAKKFKMLKAPPRPPTAYFMFLGKFRVQFKKENPDVKGIKEMSKLAGEKWRAMSDVDREPYEEKARAAKGEYNKLKAMTPEERVAATAGVDNIYAPFM